MGKTRQRPGGLVERTRTYDGKRVHFYGRRVAEVNAKIAAYEEERRRLEAVGPLFESVAPEWWELYQQQVKNGTTRAYQGGYNSAMQEFTGYHMKEITPAVVDNWSRKFKSRGMAGGTARNARSVLSLIFKYWCIRDDQVYNPVPMTSLPRGMKKTEREPPTPAQLAAVKAHPESFGLCAWLFMYTGCRLGEVLALQWRDIDWEAGRIHVSKSVTWIHNQPVVQIPKTKNAVRIIPLLSPLRALLEPLSGQPEEYILGGERPLSGTSYQRRWTYYCKGIGLAHYKIVTRKNHHKGKEYTTNAKVWEADVTAHQFRHEFASILYEANVGELEAQKLLGHSDITTTRRIYTHIRERQLENAAAQIENYIQTTSK